MLSKIPRNSRITSNKRALQRVRRPTLKLSPQKRHFAFDPTTLSLAVGVPSLLTVGLVAFAIHRYKISTADQYLVRTGLGIRDILVTKKGYQWPFQTFSFVDMHPENYSFELNSMSSEKMEFMLPGSFTIGPKNDTEAIKKYVMRFGTRENKSHIHTVISGIIEGETRVLSATMTIEQIFNGRKEFKETLINGVQEELDEFGLKIYNANIKELTDTKGSEYFSFLRQKRRSEAENNAKIDVAEATKKGTIGEKERDAVTRQEVAQYEANAVLKENERQQEIAKSKADLEVVNAAAHQKTETARIEADNNIKIREAEMQKDVEFKRIAMETEKMRASDLSKTQVEAEKVTKEAEGKANAVRIKADADFYSNQKAADARLYSKQKEADGIAAIYSAQSGGVNSLITSFKGDPATLIQYLMLDRGTFEALAKTNATAIQGLQPRLNIWTTSNDATSNSDSYTKPIADIMKMIPPLVSTINDQTGIKFAEGLVKLPPSSKNMA